MSITYVAFYPSDWLAGTRGLTAEETGVYITLIARMYEAAGPVERNDDRLARLCGCSKARFRKALATLIDEGKITESDDGLFNARCASEIAKTVDRSAKARAAAGVKWAQKSSKKRTKNERERVSVLGEKHNENNKAAMRSHPPSICQPEPEPEEGTNVPSKRDIPAQHSTAPRASDTDESANAALGDEICGIVGATNPQWAMAGAHVARWRAMGATPAQIREGAQTVRTRRDARGQGPPADPRYLDGAVADAQAGSKAPPRRRAVSVFGDGPDVY